MTRWIGLFALCALSANAQVRLLWRTAITNMPSVSMEQSYVPATNYMVTGSAVDSQGNVIFAGFAENLFYGGCFIAKFDPNGRKLWERTLATNSPSAIDDLAVDRHDRIIISARFTPPPFEGSRPVSLIQLSPTGEELWRRSADFAPGSQPTSAFSALKLDARDGIFFSYLTLGDPAGPPGYSTKLWVSKFTRDGIRLWRTLLPIKGYVLGRDEMSRFMSPTPDGGLVIAGTDTGGDHDFENRTEFLIKLNALGKIRWELKSRTPEFSNMAINRFGQLCVGGDDGITLFNVKNGKQQTHSPMNPIVVLSAMPDGGFLLWRWTSLAKVDRLGQEVWSADTRFLASPLGVVPDGAGGWIAAGRSYPSSPPDMNLLFFGCAPDGTLTWRTTLRGFAFRNETPYWRSLQALHRAPDGTLRAVVNETSTVQYPYTGITGIGIYSFAVEP